MCCQNDDVLDLPADAIEALARYRRLRAGRGPDWGDDRVPFSRWAGFPLLGAALDAWAEEGGGGLGRRRPLAGPLPAGVVVATR